MEHLGALAGKLQHLVVGDLLQLLRLGNHPRVCGVHAVHVGVNLAKVRPEGRRQGNGAGVGPAPAQGGDVAVAVHALEAGDDHNPVLVQLCPDALGVDLLDPGVGVDGGGLDAHLPRRQRHAGQPHALQGHGAQGHGDLLSSGQQHIHLPLGGVGIDLLRLGDQVVGGISLGREDHDHVVALQIGLRDDARHISQPLGIPDGAAAEFLHNQTHSRVSFFNSNWGCTRGADDAPPVSLYAPGAVSGSHASTRMRASTVRAPDRSRASRPVMTSVKKAVSPSSLRTSTWPKAAAAPERLSSTRK